MLNKPIQLSGVPRFIPAREQGSCRVIVALGIYFEEPGAPSVTEDRGEASTRQLNKVNPFSVLIGLGHRAGAMATQALFSFI